MSPEPHSTDSIDRHSPPLAGAAARLSQMAGAAVDLVGRTMANVDRIVGDVVADSRTVARESEALFTLAARQAVSVQAAIRSTPRFVRIVTEVLRLVAAYRIQQTRSRGLAQERVLRRMDSLHRSGAERLYRLCVELRGGVLKIGQFVSTRLDLLPAPYVESLSRLQDRVPPVPAAQIQERIEAELGRPISELFAAFETEPLAAASLAQVHGAQLADGTRVAVKVQMPGIEKTMEIDLAAFRVLAATLRDVFPELDLVTVADELSRCVRQELDFTAEAEHARRFGEMFDKEERVLVPGIFPDLSSERVLTMSRMDGQRLTDYLEQCRSTGEPGAARLDSLFELLIRCTCTQVLEHALFQADPHPGNFLVCPGPRLVLLDFGAVKALPPEVRDSYGRLAAAILGRDRQRMSVLLRTLGFGTRDGQEGALLDLAGMLLDVFRPDPDHPLQQIDPRALFEQALVLARQSPGVRVPQDFVLLGRVFATLGGLLMHYRPRISLHAILAPHLLPILARCQQQNPT